MLVFRHYRLASLCGALQVISLVNLHMRMEYIIHDSKVDFLLKVGSFLPIEYDLMQAIYLGNEGLRIFICDILVVLLQYSFD
jgi:hypothetical protein